MNSRLNKDNLACLISPSTRIEAPFVRVEIAGYTFGVYEGSGGIVNENNIYMYQNERFPNYI